MKNIDLPIMGAADHFSVGKPFPRELPRANRDGLIVQIEPTLDERQPVLLHLVLILYPGQLKAGAHRHFLDGAFQLGALETSSVLWLFVNDGSKLSSQWPPCSSGPMISMRLSIFHPGWSRWKRKAVKP